jgi:hypothetical protein
MRWSLSSPSGPIVKAVYRDAKLSPTMSVEPSSVITMPFGTTTPLAATQTAKLGVARDRTRGIDAQHATLLDGDHEE